MVVKKLKFNSDKTHEIIEGNKSIDNFLGDINAKIFTDSYYWLDRPYHQSWDSLMVVIKKIRTQINLKGYSLFSFEHKLNIDIGNACYDCDLELAWRCTVRWIESNYVREERDISSKEFLVVSSHAIDRFKERVEDIDDSEILKILSSDYLREAYLKKGNNSRIYLNGYEKVWVIIKDFTVITVMDELEDEEVYFKNKKIA